MGTLSGGFWGLPRGKGGNVIFCVRNGKGYFYAAPETKGIKKSEAQKKMISRFSCTSSLCSCINRIRVLREQWESIADDAYSAYSRMIKQNSKRITSEFNISAVELAAGMNKFQFGITGISFNDNEFTINAAPYPGSIIGGKRMSLQGVLQLLEPEDKNRHPFSFIPVYTKDTDILEGVPMIFECEFSNQESVMIKQYRKKNLLINLAVKNIQSAAEIFSEEIYLESL